MPENIINLVLYPTLIKLNVIILFELETIFINNNQYYKLTEKYNKICQDMENVIAENRILRRLHGVP